MQILLLSLVMFLQVSSDELKNKAVKAFDTAESKVLNVSPDKPDVVEKCPCNGTGVIVHGDGHRTACPGTEDGPCQFRRQGDVAQVEQPKKAFELPKNNQVTKVVRDHALIVMESQDGCLPCEKIKRSQFLKDLLKSGWRFKVISPRPGTLEVPKLTVYMGGQPIPIKDLTVEEINRVNQIFSDRIKK